MTILPLAARRAALHKSPELLRPQHKDMLQGRNLQSAQITLRTFPSQYLYSRPESVFWKPSRRRGYLVGGLLPQPATLTFAFLPLSANCET